MAATTGVKTEGELKIKADPDGLTHDIHMGEGDYEDTGELEIPSRRNGAWLTRIPKILYDKWAKIDDDEEIQLGIVRRYRDSGAMKLLLDPHGKYSERVPTEYELRIAQQTVANTFVFSEKDFAGFKGKGKNGVKGEGADRKEGIVGSQSKIDKSRRFQPYYKKAIPKQTKLAASIDTELSCVAVENEEYRRLMKERFDEEIGKQKGTTILDQDVRTATGMVLSGTGKGGLADAGGFNTFIRNAAAPGRTKTQQDNKAARIAQDQLLDQIFECFKQYPHWGFKTLKDRLRQPESYLKETLAKVAELVKSGPFALNWRLKPEFQQSNVDVAKGELAPEDAAAPDAESSSDPDIEGDDEPLDDDF